MAWKKWTVAAASLFVAAPQADASSVNPGYVTGVEFASNRMLFYVSGARSARPACDCCNRWEIDGSVGNAQFEESLVLSAYASHRAVNIAGTGACVGSSNDTEGVSYIESD